MAVRIKSSISLSLQNVTKAVDRYEERLLNRGGAYVRQTMRRSIRKRKRASEPGKPPSSKTGGLRNNIFYSVHGRAVFIGPIDFNNDNIRVPELLEFGGKYEKDAQAERERQRRLKAAVGNLRRRGRGKRRNRRPKEWFRERARQNRQLAQGRMASYEVRARPYSGAALVKTVQSGKFQELWGTV